jgi:hypothetical protein
LLRFFPLGVTDQLTRLLPVFLPASFFVILLATFLGLQAGYFRFSPLDLLGQIFSFLPDLTVATRPFAAF